MQETTVSYGLMFEKAPTELKANIHFHIPVACKLILKVLCHEEEVRLLMNETVNVGNHVVEFNFSHLPKELYSIKLIVETAISIDKETIIVQL